ncbi:MAG: putative Threonine synthase [Promethearchaeota archaeon]|nr:MAG: putative Threonine synthase [Candidatus Lokiarchaeota archaeon]
MASQQKYFFKCVKCHHLIEKNNVQITKCPKCNNPLAIKMNIEFLKESTSENKFFEKDVKSMWSFFEFLPLDKKENIISLKEGNTPILKSKRLEKDLGVNNLFLKLDFLNPTASFKDRQISMGISKAKEYKKTAVITMSSGNVGAAVAAYSARSGMNNIILIPSIAPESKILQIKQYGGNVVKIRSDSTEFISNIVKEACRRFDMANLITAGIYNPFIINGAKTISYEILYQCKSEETKFPDIIILPVGGSGLLSGVYEGFKELYELDILDSIPKMIGVQPEGCAPFVRAIKEDLSPEYLFEHPWKGINTISTALADDIPLDCYTGIPAVKESKGTAISVTDKETLEASKKLSQLEGIFAEPSSCTTIAALKKLLKNKQIKEDENIYCIITGSGFKDIKSIKPIISESIEVNRDFNWEKTFRKILNSQK